jgi:hypothetical protein
MGQPNVMIEAYFLWPYMVITPFSTTDTPLAHRGQGAGARPGIFRESGVCIVCGLIEALHREEPRWHRIRET